MKEQLIQERANLSKALKEGSITTNEYQDLYYAYSQRIKKLS
jgi:hypothetical protein